MSSYAFGLLDAHYDCFRVLFFFKSHSLSPNCWDTLLSSCPPNVGELTAITNFGRTGGRGDGPEAKKKQRWVQVSQLFLSETASLSNVLGNESSKMGIAQLTTVPLLFY